MRTKPVPMSKAELLGVLDDMRARVAGNDSLEGHIEYLMPFDDDKDITEGPEFVVSGGYRVGNLWGQGGMRIIGKLR